MLVYFYVLGKRCWVIWEDGEVGVVMYVGIDLKEGFGWIGRVLFV